MCKIVTETFCLPILFKVCVLYLPRADCSCGILVCGKSAAKFHPAADLPQTVPVAYWYAASLQQNFFLPHTSAYSLPQTKSLRQVCGRSAAGLRQVCGILFTFLWVRHDFNPSLLLYRYLTLMVARNTLAPYI